MNFEKLEALHFTAGIHTVSIRSEQESQLHYWDVPWIGNEQQCLSQKETVPNQSKKWNLYQLNMNKFIGEKVLSLQEFCQLMKEATKAMGLTSWEYSRIDTRFDLYEGEYEQHLKLLKLILLLLSEKYKLKNRFQSSDPLTLEEKTVRVQTPKKNKSNLQVEFYNKQLESPGDEAISRLEFRTCKVYKYSTADDLKKLISEWVKRLEKSISGYEQLQQTCNKYLLKRWEKVRAAGKVKNRNDFIRMYQENIYTKQQLSSLLEAMGAPNPLKQASNIRTRDKLEFFTQRELETVLNAIQESLNAYFEVAPTKSHLLRLEQLALGPELDKLF